MDNPEFPTDPNNPTKTTTGTIPYVPDTWTPNNPNEGSKKPINPTNNPGEDVKVPFHQVTPTVNDQKAVVNYIDSDENNALITTSGDLTGKPDTKIDYSTTSTIKDLENKGYVLVHDGFPKDATYDNDDNTVQTYEVVFKHGHQPVNPDTPGNPGQPINPGNPDGPKYPEGTKKNNLTETYTRTINYVGAGDQTPSQVNQPARFTGSGTLDKVTGKWILSDGTETDDINKGITWSADQTLSAVPTKIINGYHIVSVSADSKDGINVDAKTISHQNGSEVVTVTYAPNGHIIPVYPDPTDPTKPGQPIPNVDHPQYPTNPENPKDVTPNEPVPNVPGLTPETPTVTPQNPGEDTKVIYNEPKADEGSVNIFVHDNTTGQNLDQYGWSTGNTPVKVGTKVTFDKPGTIKKLTDKGYKVINPDVEIPAEVAKGNINVTIYVEHGTQPVNPDIPGKPGQPINPGNPDGPKYPSGTDKNSIDKTVIRTINFVDNKGNKVHDSIPQPVHFTASGVLDKVTGKWILSDGTEIDDINKGMTWSADQSFNGMDVPVVNGYHVISIDKDHDGLTKITTATVGHDDKDYYVTVTYEPNGHIIPVYPDPTDPTKPGQPIPNVPNPQYPTNPDNPSTVTPNEPVPNIPGYTPETPTVTPNKPGEDTKVIYKENTVVNGKQTVHYVDENGNPLLNPTVNDQVTFTKDVGTGKWDKNSYTYKNVNAPVITGYVMTKKTFNGEKVTPDQPNQDIEIVYKKIGKIIPIDPNGNPIPNAPTPEYHNDPTDPTKVIPNEPVPNIPDMVPDQSTVTPTDPTKDTPVIYRKDNHNPGNPGGPTVPPTTPQPSTPSQPTEAPSNPTAPTQPTTAPGEPTVPDVPKPSKDHHRTPSPAPTSTPHKYHTNMPKPAAPTNTGYNYTNMPKPAAPTNTGYNYTNMPHSQNGNFGNVAPHAGNNVAPIGQNLPNDDMILPNGQVIDSNGNVVGYVDKNGQVHYTLPQTGESNSNDIASALAGGAAVAIGLVGLAGVRKRRRINFK